jgi:hypothetical protein
MPVNRNLAEREAPRWVVMSVAVAALVILAYFGSKAISGRAADPAPPRRVYPGMYDLRAEAARMRAAQQNRATPNGR